MRFFIALEIPEENKIEIQIIQRGLKKLIPQIRLTDPEKLHLTLAFIGEQPDMMRDQLVEIMHNATFEIPPFEITPAYLDAFPALRDPSTFWIGVKGDIEKLINIKRRLRDELLRAGLPPDERRFIPHIAIGKVINFKPLQFHKTQFEEIMNTPLKPIRVNCLKLFESIPEEGFHKHNTLAEIALG